MRIDDKIPSVVQCLRGSYVHHQMFSMFKDMKLLPTRE